MKYLLSLVLLIATFSGCSSSENAVSEMDSEPIVQEKTQPNERISFNINEVIYFDFFKYDSVWTGELSLFTLNEEGEKVVKSKYVSVQDSTWDDVDLFVDFLNLYEIPPQNELEGWVPNSGQLPQRVYNFELFDGDSTSTFSYQDPEKNLRDYWQVQNLLTFVTFVQTDLQWVEAE